MNNNKIRLNPFVYISETDARFYLLVFIGIIMPSLWALIFGLVIYHVEMAGVEITLFLRLLIVIPMISFIPLFIYWDYKKFPKKIIKDAKLKEFDKKKYPEHHEYIEKLHEEYLSTEKKPTLMVQPLDTSKSAFTFGAKSQMFIGLPGGLIKIFRKNINAFKSIYLHEMGHIVNRDVEKTYLANSTWRSIFLTLSILYGIFILHKIYLILGTFYFGILSGYDMDYIISAINLGKSVSLYGGILLYFLFFLGIIYVLRNQIIRTKEFYADAKVLELEKSPEMIVKTLEESGVEQYSRFEILKKFHPHINERIQVLENNRSLFIPSLWVAFSIGFFLGLIELTTWTFSLSSSYWDASMSNQNYQSDGEMNILFLRAMAIFIFPILMLPVSSSFHKLSIQDIFMNNKKYFSSATALYVIKFSLAFSLGWMINVLIEYSTLYISLDELNILISDFLNIVALQFKYAFDFSLVLLYILIFSSILIRTSFNKKDAEKNFILVSVLSSLLFIIDKYYFVETLQNRSLFIVFFPIFSLLTYILIKIKNKNSFCPGCNRKMNLSILQTNCPQCQQELYPWAIYSFS